MAVIASLKTLPGLVATSDLSAKQYYVVKMATTDGQVKVVTATTDEAIGVLNNDPESGEAAQVANGGLGKVINGTSVGWSDGIAVGFNTTGKAVPLAANSTNDNRRAIGKFYSIGQSDAPALNQLISVELYPGALRI